MAGLEKQGRSSEREAKQKTSETVIFIRSDPRGISSLEAHLRAFRLRNGILQKDLADEAGITGSTYQQLEQGLETKLSAGKVDRIIDAIGRIADEDAPHAMASVIHLSALKMDRKSRSRVRELIEAEVFNGEIRFHDSPPVNNVE